MKTITLKTAQAIAADWHGGQRSALYAFSSTGILLPEKVAATIAEIKYNLKNDNTLPGQAKRLEKLERFIAVRFQTL